MRERKGILKSERGNERRGKEKKKENEKAE